MARIAFKLSTMVGENFKSYLYQMTRIGFKLSTMVGEIFESYLHKMARIAFKLSMVEENFENYLHHQMAKISFKLSTMVGENSSTFRLLTTTSINWRIKFCVWLGQYRVSHKKRVNFKHLPFRPYSLFFKAVFANNRIELSSICCV